MLRGKEEGPSASSQSFAADARVVCEGNRLSYVPSEEQVSAVRFKDCAENGKVGKRSYGPNLKRRIPTTLIRSLF